MSPPLRQLDETPAAAAVATLLATAIAAASTSTSNVSASIKPHTPPHGECSLIGPFALIVQLALGAAALLVLVFKRWRERPQRPVKVWFFDVSKQVVGSVLLHMANLVMSMLSSGKLGVDVAVVETAKKEGENPCSFYFLNLLIDTTIGIPLLIFFLHILTALFLQTSFGQPPQSLESGRYGHPPKAKWWAKQSLIYFLGLVGMKLVVLLIFVLLPWISIIGDWALKWTEGNEELQVGFVMLFFPVVMNATQYYIIDTFIKDRSGASDDGVLGSDDEDSGSDLEDEVEGLLGDQEAVTVKHKSAHRHQASTDYDESRDGAVESTELSPSRASKLLTENDEFEASRSR